MYHNLPLICTTYWHDMYIYIYIHMYHNILFWPKDPHLNLAKNSIKNAPCQPCHGFSSSKSSEADILKSKYQVELMEASAMLPEKSSQDTFEKNTVGFFLFFLEYGDWSCSICNMSFTYFLNDDQEKFNVRFNTIHRSDAHTWHVNSI